jgi:thiol-disulfide isomerase/thioredoxin
MTKGLKQLTLATAVVILPSVAAIAQQEPDLQGRTALLEQIESAVESGSRDSAETLLAEFRRRYPASSRVRGWDNGNEVVYLYDPVYQLAESYAEEGDFAKALQVYEDEIAGLAIEVPHYSWRFVGLAIPYQLETGAKTSDEIRSRVQESRARFAAMREEVAHPGRKDLFDGLVSRMDSALHHLDLLRAKAPGFTFTQAFNADTSLSLDSLRGKVVLIDFWATWCAPCMAAWPDLAALHDRWADRGFEMLSITSLQGSVGAEKGLTPEREVELTREFIERHGVTWPVLFSERSVNDPEYGATTLPSYVIINRDGNVESVLVGQLGALGEAIIERLLAGGSSS